MNSFLLIARAGVRSVHNAWIDRGTPRNYDLYVCPHETVPFWSDPVERFEVGPVYPEVKWLALHRLLSEWSGWRDYDYICIADDDVLMRQAEWSRFFEIVRVRRPALAQPSLTHDSFWSHILTLQNKNFLWRETTFIEAMAPCFRVDVLDALLPSFPLSRSGWGYGLEFVWAKRIAYQDIVVVDDIAMRHFRPVGGNYPPGLMESLRAEMHELMKMEDAPWLIVTLAGQLRDKRLLPKGSAEFMRLYLDGYWDLAKGSNRVLASLLNAQANANLTL